MVGVVGIPVTELASAAQAAGIRFLGFRNEQAAGYAAAAAGFLTRTPAALLTVSGPGLVHALAGASHAQANCWPLLILSGSAVTAEVGRGGAFQELDQVSAAAPFCKFAARAAAPSDIPAALAAAIKAAVRGRPGASYVDLPADVLMAAAPAGAMEAARGGGSGRVVLAPPPPPALPPPGGDGDDTPDPAALAAAVTALRSASRPLIVIGKGAAYARADGALRAFVDGRGIPFIATSMGRGVVPDDHARCANASRAAALAGADVALIFGARLNWQLHFGDAPRWDPAVRFVLIDPAPSGGDAARAAAVLAVDAGVGAAALSAALGCGGDWTTAPPPTPWAAWADSLSTRSAAARARLEARLASAAASPLDYWTAMAALKESLNALVPSPVIVSEGANTMDMARLCLGPVREGRTRIDAGTWGTMGVGLGSAIAAAALTGRRAVAVEGDSALGFSLAELETAVRYALPLTVVVINNGGIYGGDRRPPGLVDAAAAGAAAGGFPDDPPPTAFVPGARHDLVMAAFGGRGFRADTPASLRSVLKVALSGGPALVDVIVDPGAGEESGSVHAFNAPKASSKM
jgi:2-hydroxyacyl-CoA lyase 1